MAETLRKLMALYRHGSPRLAATGEFFERLRYPNFGLGALVRNMPTRIGAINTSPSQYWNTHNG